MSDKHLQEQISLWREINNYANRIEESYPKFYTLLITLFGVVITVFHGNLVPEELFDEKFIVLLFLPLATSAIISYLAYNFRWVAISRMYATALEKNINNILGKNIYVWNSNIIDEFMAKRNFANTKLLPIINLLFFIFIAGFLNYSMFISQLNFVVKIVYLITTLTLFLMCVCPIIKNEYIRKYDYQFPISELCEKQAEELSKKEQ